MVQLFYHNNNSWTRCRSRVKLCLCAAFFLASAGGVYYSLVQNGINPDWSIEKALKWCKKRQWVKVCNTRLFDCEKSCAFHFQERKRKKQINRVQLEASSRSRSILLWLWLFYSRESAFFYIPCVMPLFCRSKQDRVPALTQVSG